jgi:hypothetical protein
LIKILKALAASPLFADFSTFKKVQQNFSFLILKSPGRLRLFGDFFLKSLKKSKKV